MKLNYGCGEQPLEGYTNVDSVQNKITKPDLIADIKLGSLPFDNETFEEICALHCIEHIERGWWPRVFQEFHRILQPNGLLILAYPEFERCAHNFITNYKGARDFWRMTLYGRQDHPGDYHVVPMRTEEIISILNDFGFYDVQYGPEVDEDWSTFLTCKRGKKPVNREELYKKEMFA